MTSTPAPSRTALLLAFAAIYLIWGSTYLGIRVAVQTMPPFLMAGMRFAIAGALIFGFLRLRGAPWPTAMQWKDQVVIGIFLLLVETRSSPGPSSGPPRGSPPWCWEHRRSSWFSWSGSGRAAERPTVSLVVGVAVGIALVALLLGPDAIPEGYRPRAIDILALFVRKHNAGGWDRFTASTSTRALRS